MSICYFCLGVLQQVRANLAFEILVGDGDHNSHPTDRVSSVRDKFNHEKWTEEGGVEVCQNKVEFIIHQQGNLSESLENEKKDW